MQPWHRNAPRYQIQPAPELIKAIPKNKTYSMGGSYSRKPLKSVFLFFWFSLIRGVYNYFRAHYEMIAYTQQRQVGLN